MSRARRTRHGTEGGGFTLVELLAVVTVVAIMLVAVVPAFDGMIPKYRLRSAAREVASLIEQAQSEAVAKRREFAIAYDLEADAYWLVLPPPPPEPPPEEERTPEEEAAAAAARPADDIEHGVPPPDPEAAPPASGAVDFAEQESLTPRGLPQGVVFEMVVRGEDEERSGEVRVAFSHTGATAGTHIVGLKLRDTDTMLWVRFNALTRTIQISEDRPQLRTLEGESR